MREIWKKSQEEKSVNELSRWKKNQFAAPQVEKE